MSGLNSVQPEKTLQKAALEQYLAGGFSEQSIITQVCGGGREGGRGLLPPDDRRRLPPALPLPLPAPVPACPPARRDPLDRPAARSRARAPPPAPTNRPQVENGKGAMPAWAGRLSDEEIQVGGWACRAWRPARQSAAAARGGGASWAGVPAAPGAAAPARPPPAHPAVDGAAPDPSIAAPSGLTPPSSSSSHSPAGRGRLRVRPGQRRQVVIRVACHQAEPGPARPGPGWRAARPPACQLRACGGSAWKFETAAAVQTLKQVQGAEYGSEQAGAG